MKILFLNTDYPKFINTSFKNNPRWLSYSYEKQIEEYFSLFFGTSNFYSKNIKKLCEDAKDVVINNQYLQKKWLKEKNIKYSKILEILDKNRITRTLKRKFYLKNDWYYRAMLEQIKEYKPDVIYVQLMAHVSPLFLKKIKKHCKLIVGQIACPIPPLSDFSKFDLILSTVPNYVEKFRKKGLNSEYFKLGFEDTLLQYLKKKDNQPGVVHVGGYGKVHNERNDLLEKVSNRIKIDFWGYGENNLMKNSPILNNFHGESWGLDMFNVLYNSKITTTKHIDSVAGKYAANMTLYEATGVGTLLITDEKENLSEIFEIGKEIETYNNAEDLTKKIKYYLEHEEERLKIAKAGQARTLRDHTYKKRMEELIIILNKYV